MPDPPAQHFEAVAREALKAFPIEPAGVTLVWVSENVTLRVTDRRDGAAYALRLHRPGYHDLTALTSERSWTRALAAAGLTVPADIACRDGRDFNPVTLPNGEKGFAGLTRWVEGELLTDVLQRQTPAQATRSFRGLGATVAALHDQAAGWTPPLGFRRHALDTEGLMGEGPFWGPFWESRRLTPSERDLLRAARDRIAAVLDRLQRTPNVYSLIHADLHPNNVLVADGRMTVIDFDDAAFGWHAYDIAVALFRYWSAPDLPAILGDFLFGYRAIRRLEAEIEATIPMFLLIRALALIGWQDQRAELDPGPEFEARKTKILRECQMHLDRQ